MNSVKEKFDALVNALPDKAGIVPEDINLKITAVNLLEESEQVTDELVKAMASAVCWSDGCFILCSFDGMENDIADFLERDAGDDNNVTVLTGYYDPDDDRKNDEEDDHTGYYYVDIV